MVTQRGDPLRQLEAGARLRGGGGSPGSEERPGAGLASGASHEAPPPARRSVPGEQEEGVELQQHPLPSQYLGGHVVEVQGARGRSQCQSL